MKIEKIKNGFYCRTGSRKIAGTDWPVESFVRRERFGKRWELLKSLCNSVPAGTEYFKTRKAALAALESWTGCQLLAGGQK